MINNMKEREKTAAGFSSVMAYCLSSRSFPEVLLKYVADEVVTWRKYNGRCESGTGDKRENEFWACEIGHA